MGKKETIVDLDLHRQEQQLMGIQTTEQQKKARLRVTAYIRDSSSSKDQLNSFEAQRRHHDQLIFSQEQWELVEVVLSSYQQYSAGDGVGQICKEALMDHITNAMKVSWDPCIRAA